MFILTFNNEHLSNICSARTLRSETFHYEQSVEIQRCLLGFSMGSGGVGGYLVAAVHLNLPDRVIDKILNLAAAREW